MICVDQNTGEMDKNVLLALRELRDSKVSTVHVEFVCLRLQSRDGKPTDPAIELVGAICDIYKKVTARCRMCQQAMQTGISYAVQTDPG